MVDKRWIQHQRTLFLGLLSGGLVACQTEVAVPFSGVSLSPALLQGLTYPPFLADPLTAERYRQQGLAYRRAGDWERAIAAFKIATALDPQNPNGYVILGWTQHLSGYRHEAAQTLGTALRYDPNLIPALNALGIVYLVDGQLQEAVATHGRAIELNPDNEIAHYNLSLAYERLGQTSQAIDHAHRATELEPQNPHPWVALALAYASQGDRAQALTYYREALRLDGRYRDRTHLDHLERAGFNPEQIAKVATLQQSSSSP
ncbi:MAG TPA: tetratricopeptide repeat protein [Leptolyngbyaceae cyanobacterium M65_K2018_010]|nr:tetratricopeptide repeat protein [Leptolyngbyaceae cyanobacterium M65_K2018_010]